MAEDIAGTGPVYALGLMSGTSLDGIDAALIRTDGEQVYEFGPWLTAPYEANLRDALRRLVEGGRDGVDEVEKALTEAHAEAAAALIAEAGYGAGKIHVVGFHGHTIWHDPSRRVTNQIGDGALLSRRLAIDVVNDFRAADVAAGGQGAPLAPLYHWALAQTANNAIALPLAVLNLGGVANVTWIGTDKNLCAFDTGPGCALIDDWLLARSAAPFDRDGALARRGSVDEAALASLLHHPYFAAPPPKSLDRNAFDSASLAPLSDADGAATLTAFTAQAVALGLDLCPEKASHLLVTGGGRHNPSLLAALRERTGIAVEPVETLGWRGDALEAEAFAFLAVRSLNGAPLSLPETTGVRAPLSGGVLHRAG
ncbi:MAG: anhydro-N-acetylmuramic acid kinase [Alphaproteobacteria bacterium]|nr:anhydro-N-acetylmuramic acid kinase [Alphaproteobacteria bacterium]MDP6588108.1 anhydro-N-acetylmuramic acid kinase [Alphaproteobacteria bacterium]MDP6816771.1 anhydro-N-acetylmuramic acid kinase [Alphaproteobacteria bacterium]